MTNLNAPSSKKSRLAVFLLILLIIETQYIINDWVVHYGSNSNIVNDVSFAGTIVSIILAVLAIVYSYYQNFSQQRDAYNLAAQIQNLRDAVGHAESSGRGFSDAINRLEDISIKIDKNISLGEESHKLLKGMNESNIEKRSALDAAAARGGANRPLDLPEIARRLVRVATLGQLAVYYILVRGAESKMTLNDVKVRAIDHVFGKQYKTYYRGFTQCSAYMLLDLRIVKLTKGGDDPFIIDEVMPEFKDDVVMRFEGFDRSKAGDEGIDIENVINIFS